MTTEETSQSGKTSRNYEVGYGKPPKHTRFAKGRSGNPKGRPKGSRNFSTIVRDALNMPVKIKDRYGEREVRAIEASVRQLAAKAAAGDLKAIPRVVALASAYDDENAEAVRDIMHSSDEDILEGFVERRLRRRGSGGSQGHDPKAEAPRTETAEDGAFGDEGEAGDSPHDPDRHENPSNTLMDGNDDDGEDDDDWLK